MRTLKKVLALTLALATLFSLTAFAAYKDESKIDPDVLSAVNLVSSLKIMMGDENGFRPTDTIKRSEAAKMVYVLRTGGKTDADGWKGQNLFTDMKGHWAEGYVNYCASVGIIAGVGNKKFNPNGNVTGVELAKMLLVAAGYKADIQGYAGAQWANKVLADAESVGMFDGYDAAYMAAAPRQYAAQMFANALLRTNMAVYLSGELVTGIVANPVLVGTKYFGLVTKTGLMSDVSKDGFKLTSEKDNKPVVENIVYKNPNADLNYQSVTVVYNDRSKEVYDMYASGKSKVYNANFSDLTVKEVTANTKYTVELPGYSKTEYKAADVIKYVKTTDGTSSGVNIITDSTAKALFTLVDNSTLNSAVRFIDQDGNGTLDVMIGFNDAYVQVSKNSATDGLVVSKAALNVSKDDYSKIKFIDTVAKNDIIQMYRDMSGAICVKKVEPTKAVANGYAGSKYNLGGTNYYFADNAFNNSNAAILANLGKEIEIYTDGANLVYATTVSGAVNVEFSSNVALLKDYYVAGSTLAGTNKVEVVLATGDTKIFEYVDISGNYKASELAAGLKDNIFEYVLKDGKISLKKGTSDKGIVIPSNNDNMSYGFISESKSDLALSKDKVFTADSKVMKTNENSFLFVKVGTGADAKYKVLKASELAAFSGKTGYDVAYTTSKTGVNTLAFGFVAMTTLPSDVSAKDYLIVKSLTPNYVWDATANDGEGATVAKVSVKLFNGEDTMLTVDDSTISSGSFTFTKGNRYSYTTTGGVATLVPAAGDDTTYFAGKTLKGFDATSILVDGKFYTLAEGAKIFYVKSDGSLTTDNTELRTDLTIEFTLDKADGKVTTIIVTNWTPAS